MVSWVEINDFAQELDDIKVGLGDAFKDLIIRICSEDIVDEHGEYILTPAKERKESSDGVAMHIIISVHDDEFKLEALTLYLNTFIFFRNT